MEKKQGKVTKIYSNKTKTGKDYWSFYVEGIEQPITTFEDMAGLEGLTIEFNLTEKTTNDKTFYNASKVEVIGVNGVLNLTPVNKQIRSEAIKTLNTSTSGEVKQEFNGARFGMCCNLAMQKQAMEGKKAFDWTLFGKDVEDFHNAIKMIEGDLK
jgi:hypothetical protein